MQNVSKQKSKMSSYPLSSTTILIMTIQFES